MASLVKRNGIYYAEFFDSTRTPSAKRYSLRTRRKPDARRQLAELETKWTNGEFDPWLEDPRSLAEKVRPEYATTKEALELFLADKEASGCTKNTISNYRHFCTQLISEIGPEKPVAAIKAVSVKKFVYAPHLANASKRTRFRHVRAWLKWCERHGMTRKCVTDEIPIPPDSEKMPKAVREKDLKKIEEVMRDDYAEKREKRQAEDGEIIWMIPMFWFALYSGLRSSDIGRLRWKHIDFDRNQIRIYEQKNGKEQTIPLTKPARRILEKLPAPDPNAYVFAPPTGARYERDVTSFVGRIGDAFREYRRVTGIDRKLTPHGLRHGFCTILAEAGKSAPIIKEAARHADISTSMRYVHIANEKLKAELDEVFSENEVDTD